MRSPKAVGEGLFVCNGDERREVSVSSCRQKKRNNLIFPNRICFTTESVGDRRFRRIVVDVDAAAATYYIFGTFSGAQTSIPMRTYTFRNDGHFSNSKALTHKKIPVQSESERLTAHLLQLNHSWLNVHLPFVKCIRRQPLYEYTQFARSHRAKLHSNAHRSIIISLYEPSAGARSEWDGFDGVSSADKRDCGPLCSNVIRLLCGRNIIILNGVANALAHEW